MLSFFSSRRNWDSPTPLAAGECAPHPLVRGGGHTCLLERGWWSPNSDEGIYTVVIYIYEYFVVEKIFRENMYVIIDEFDNFEVHFYKNYTDFYVK